MIDIVAFFQFPEIRKQKDDLGLQKKKKVNIYNIITRKNIYLRRMYIEIKYKKIRQNTRKQCFTSDE